jgi:hypothetical protein
MIQFARKNLKTFPVKKRQNEVAHPQNGEQPE